MEEVNEQSMTTEIKVEQGIKRDLRSKTMEHYYKKKEEYRFMCPCCLYRTWWKEVMRKHVYGKRHVASRKLGKQEYDYLEWPESFKMDQEPKGEGTRVLME